MKIKMKVGLLLTMRAVTYDMILLKGYFELETGQSESEIRESITEVLK